eukprot:2546147-Prymnesium_polylepis.1
MPTRTIGGSPNPPLKMRGETPGRSCGSTERTTLCVHRAGALQLGSRPRRDEPSAGRLREPGEPSGVLPSVPPREWCFLNRTIAARAASDLRSSDPIPSHVASSGEKCFHLTKYSSSAPAPRASRIRSTS